MHDVPMRFGRRGRRAAFLAIWVLAGQGLAGTCTWTGAANSNWFDAGNWTPALPVAGDAVLITNAGNPVLLTSSTPDLVSLTLSNKTLTVSNGITRILASNVFIQYKGTITVASVYATNGVAEHQMSNQVYIVCTNFILDAGGAINADGKGFAGGEDSHPTGCGPGGGAVNGGGGHGGRGGRDGRYASTLGGYTNDAIDAPTQPGSGGGEMNNDWHGGNGGGLVSILAPGGGVTINGTVTANGAIASNAGGGAGGGINISCATFGGSSTGLLSAAGGNGGRGGGGGGRIAVNYTTLAVPAAVQFNLERGTGTGDGYLNNPWSGMDAQKGTLYFPNLDFLNQRITESDGIVQGITGYVVAPSTTNWSPTNSMLTLTNAWIGFFLTNFTLAVTNLTIEKSGVLQLRPGNLICASNLTVTNGGALYIYSAATNEGAANYGALVSVGGTLQIASNSWVYPVADMTNGGAPLFQVTHLTIAAGGGIKTDLGGYAGGLTTPTTGYGPGGGATGRGGGHGGRGGGASGGMENDTLNAPTQPGSGGGDGNADWPGGQGGGLVRILAAGTVLIDGTVTANGDVGSGASAGGGAGGGINISCATFGGSSTGLLSATGGTGNGGSGGGGRIAVGYANLAAPCAVRFSTECGKAGNYWDYSAAQKGTVYFPDAQLLNTNVTDSGGVFPMINGYLAVGGVPAWTNWVLDSLVISNSGTYVYFPANFTLAVTNGLAIKNSGALGLLGGSLNCPAGLIVSNGGALHVCSAATTNGLGANYGALVTAGGTMQIASNGWVYVYSHPTNGLSPLFQVKDLALAVGGTLSANSNGFAGGGYSADGFGLGGGGGNATRGAGGGHGGRGGWSQYLATYGDENGDTNAPALPGSGGGGNSTTYGGAGGGLVAIQAAGMVTIDGTLTANGTTGGQGGGGAGGGININCASFGGSSTGALLSAAGINGGSDVGAGGGGRIAVWVDVPQNIRTRYIASTGADGRAVARLTNWPAFSGTFSVANGTGYRNPPTNGCALPGTVFFFKYLKGGQLRY